MEVIIVSFLLFGVLFVTSIVILGLLLLIMGAVYLGFVCMMLIKIILKPALPSRMYRDSYFAEAIVEYEVNGRKIQGTGFSSFANTGDKVYLVGDTEPLVINSENPSEVYDSEDSSESVLKFFLSFAILLITAGFLCIAPILLWLK